MTNPDSLCFKFKEDQQKIADLSAEKVFEAFPDVEARFGKAGVENTKQDINFHLDYLRTAVCMESKDIFVDYLAWAKSFFKSINLPDEYIIPPLYNIKAAIEAVLNPEDSAAVSEYLDYAIKAYDDMPSEQPTFLKGDHALNVLAHQYIQALLRKDRIRAENLIVDAVKQGTSVRNIYLQVFQPVQWEVGRLWQQNEITVAMEHYMTAATQFIMSRLYPYIFSTERIGKKMVATSVSGELHELGIRMVTDFFELAGWDTYYLGANTPHNSIISMIQETGSQLLAISATIPFNLPSVEELIADVRAELPPDELKILVGGKPFIGQKELWKKVGADGYALDADSAIEEANKLVV